MKIRLEILFLSLGLFGASIFLAIIILWSEIPINIREFFRGGNIGAQTLGIFIVFGFISIIFFITDLIKKEYDYLSYKMICIAIYLVMLSLIGLRV